MKQILTLSWALTLSAITVQHLTLAIPATRPGSGNVAIAISDDPRVNSTNAFSGAASLYSSFPPGPCPPGEFLFYTVPDSVPPVSIKFQNVDRGRGVGPWRPQPGRNETAMRVLLADLIEEWSGPAKIATRLSDHNYEWDEGPAPQVYINMTPQKPAEYEPQDLALTGKIWANACKGFQDFLTAYPGLGIYFEVYYLYEPNTEFYAAFGNLSLDELQRQQRVDVT